jgi:hypothetical protein
MSQVEKFKAALEVHDKNKKSRTERITARYGHGNEQIKAGVAGLSGGATNYAMFSHNATSTAGPQSIENNTGNVRRRNLEPAGSGAASSSSSSSSGHYVHSSPYSNPSSSGGSGLVQELMQQKGNTKSDHRLQTAKSVEASIAQVGCCVVFAVNVTVT